MSSIISIIDTSLIQKKFGRQNIDYTLWRFRQVNFVRSYITYAMEFPRIDHFRAS